MTDSAGDVGGRGRSAALVVAATLGSTAGLEGGPAAALLAAAGTQIALDVMGRAWDRLSERRRVQAAAPFIYAATARDASMEETMELVAGDADLSALATAIAATAAGTRLDAKLVALGRVLADAIEDVATLDIDHLMVDALDVVEPAHLKVLELLDRQYGSMTPYRSSLGDDFPELGAGMLPILRALESKALVHQNVEYREQRYPTSSPLVRAGLVPGGPVQQIPYNSWGVTEFGHDLVGRLRSASAEFGPA